MAQDKSSKPIVRREASADLHAIFDVNRQAFGRDDEARLVDALRAGGHARLSLVAELENQIVGHILFSELKIVTGGGQLSAWTLAPMAVLPKQQRHGIGSALVKEGLLMCRAAGARIVTVLGHPEFYPRFGFSAALAQPLVSPFGGGEAWMAIELVPQALAGVKGTVEYAPPFAQITD